MRCWSSWSSKPERTSITCLLKTGGSVVLHLQARLGAVLKAGLEAHLETHLGTVLKAGLEARLNARYNRVAGLCGMIILGVI